MSSQRSTAGRSIDRPLLVAGSAGGVAAWLIGYVLTFLIVAPTLRDSALNRIIEAFEGQPATYEMVGWVFFNAHLVNTVVSDIPILGTSTTSFIGGDGGFTPLLYIVPVGLLIAAGLATSRYAGATNAGEGIIAGLLVLPGYFVLAIAGTVVFSVSVAGATVGPAPLPAAAIAAIAVPGVCGGLGGAIGGITGTASRTH
ncbi:MAG: hypothetical protein ABEH64_08900 [Salinirussus sp.]